MSGLALERIRKDSWRTRRSIAAGADEVFNWHPKEDEGFALLSVTIRPREYWDIGMVFAVTYSYVPHMFGVIMALMVFLEKSLVCFEALCLLGFVAIVNDFLIKRISKEPRPITSRCHGWGMPSSHVTSSYASAVWIVYDVFLGPNGVMDGGSWIQHVIDERDRPYMHKKVSLLFGIFIVLFVFILFAPMPWARVKVGDHTWRQCFVGGLLGIYLGLFYSLAVLEGHRSFPLTRGWYVDIMTKFFPIESTLSPH